MSRSRASAKKAGTGFESAVVRYLSHALGDDRIERRRLSGANDRGDVAGVRLHGRRVVIECKDCARDELPRWISEAEAERDNDDADFGVVVHKRRGVGTTTDESMSRQFVSMSLGTFAAILAGGRDLLEDQWQ